MNYNYFYSTENYYIIKTDISTSDICAMYRHPRREIVPWIRIHLPCNTYRVRVLERETIFSYLVRGQALRKTLNVTYELLHLV